MGTNFFLQHIPTEKELQQMQELLTNKQLKELQELISDSMKSYHIGKRSYGWAFLFQAKENPRQCYDDETANVPWDTSIKSLKEWLVNPEYKIVNEYGEVFTPKQFWNEEVGEALRVHGDYMSAETYYNSHPEERQCYDNHETVINKIRWSNRWFR